MRRTFFLALLFPFSLSLAAEYKGNVGNMAAVFQLEWGDDGTVQGSYFYPERKGVVYRLKGTNPDEGMIFLDEYTGTEVSARCVLNKTLTDREIIWIGTMYNVDGREFEMILARPRSGTMPPTTPPKPVPPVPEPESTEFQVDRTFDAENVIPVLGKPGELEAHLYGNLYYGWTLPEAPSDDAPILSRLDRFRNSGDLVWAAMRIEGKDVELQFEATDGRRRILQGGNSVEGRIVLHDQDDQRWTLQKHIVGEAIVWTGGTTSAPGQSLLFYRPVNKIYHDTFASMKSLAPEAFLWDYNEWGHQFHYQRFAYTYETEIPATVESLDESDGLVTSLTLQLETGRRETIPLVPPRLRNRVPVAPGFPVTAAYRNGNIDYLLVELTPISWRQRGDHTLELNMFATEQAGITFSDLGDSILPPGRLETLDKIVLAPDYVILGDDLFVSWFIPEDKITSGMGDRGAGMLELESLSLGGEPTPSPVATEKIGPWRSLDTPVDFLTNQLRIIHMSATSGFRSSLPGEE